MLYAGATPLKRANKAPQLYNQPRRPRHHCQCPYYQSLPTIVHCYCHHQKEANRITEEAWKVAFPSLRFPVELIGVPSRKSPLVAAPHKASEQQELPPALTHQLTNGFSKLKVAINKRLESQLLKEQAFFKALKVIVAQEQTKSTPQTCCLLAAFTASHPQVSVNTPRDLDPACRLYIPVGGAAATKGTGESYWAFLLKLAKVSSCHPSALSLLNWITELAQEQYLIFSAKMENY
jgi:hypothetical protein